jgi:hypothetical protein
MRTAYKIQLSHTLRGNIFCNGVEFDNDGLSLDPVSQDRIAVFAGQGAENYSLVKYRDEEDVQQIEEQAARIAELEAEIINFKLKRDE